MSFLFQLKSRGLEVFPVLQKHHWNLVGYGGMQSKTWDINPEAHIFVLLLTTQVGT